MGNNLPLLIFTAAKLTKFSDKRVTKVLKMQFYAEKMLYVYLSGYFLLNFPVLRNDLYTDILTELEA